MSTIIIIKVNGSTVGTTKSMNIINSKTPKNIDNIFKIRFDRIRIAEAFNRGYHAH